MEKKFNIATTIIDSKQYWLLTSEYTASKKRGRPLKVSDEWLTALGHIVHSTANNEEDPRYMFLTGFMLHTGLTGANENGVGFVESDIQKVIEDGSSFSATSPVFIESNHDGKIYGLVVNPRLVDDPVAGSRGLLVDHIYPIWSYDEEQLAHVNAVEGALASGKLRFSMNVISDEVHCSICNQVFHPGDHFCEHLQNKEKTGAIMMIHNPQFLANSDILYPHEPADRFARPVTQTNDHRIAFSVDNNNKVVNMEASKMGKNTIQKVTIDELWFEYLSIEVPELLSEKGAKWTTKFINSLPDAAFAVIEPAYKNGDTTDKRARHLPHHNKSVTNPNDDKTVDITHYRNALARASQIKPITDSITTDSLRSKASKHLKVHSDVLKSKEASIESNINNEEDTMPTIEELTEEVKRLSNELSKMTEVANESKVNLEKATSNINELQKERDSLLDENKNLKEKLSEMVVAHRINEVSRYLSDIDDDIKNIVAKMDDDAFAVYLKSLEIAKASAQTVDADNISNEEHTEDSTDNNTDNNENIEHNDSTNEVAETLTRESTTVPPTSNESGNSWQNILDKFANRAFRIT